MIPIRDVVTDYAPDPVTEAMQMQRLSVEMFCSNLGAGREGFAGLEQFRANGCATALSRQAVEPASQSRPDGLQSFSRRAR